MDSSTHRNRKRKSLQVHPSGESLEGRQLLSVAGAEVDAAVPAEVMTTRAEPDVMMTTMTAAPGPGRGPRAGRQARAVQLRLARQRPARMRLARLAAMARISAATELASPAIASTSPTAATLGAPTAVLTSAQAFRPTTGVLSGGFRRGPSGNIRGERNFVLGGGNEARTSLRLSLAPIGTTPAVAASVPGVTTAPAPMAPVTGPASAMGGGHTAGRWMMPPGGALDHASLAVDSAPAGPTDPASTVTGDPGMARRKVAPPDAMALPALGDPGTMSSIRYAPTGSDGPTIDSGPTQAQLDAFDKLSADTQAIHDKSEVTPRMLAAHRKDLEAIDKAATGPADPARVQVLRSLIKAPAGALPTADQEAQIAAAFVDAIRSRGVTDDALIARTIVDAGTIADATHIDAADLALMAADRQAAGIPADSSWPDWDLDLGLSLGTNVAFGYGFDLDKPLDQGVTSVASSGPINLVAPATMEAAVASPAKKPLI